MGSAVVVIGELEEGVVITGKSAFVEYVGSVVIVAREWVESVTMVT